MFNDVVQYTDYVIEVVGRHEGRIGGERLLDVVEWSAVSFGRYRSRISGSVGVVSPGSSCFGDVGGREACQDGGVSSGVSNGDGHVEDAVGIKGGNAWVGEGSGVRGSGGVELVGVAARGINYERNRRIRERRKANKGSRCPEPKLDSTWVARKIAENKAAELRALRQVAKMEKEEQDGTVERKYQAEKAILDGQLAGKYSLTAPRHVIGFAKTVISDATTGRTSKTVWSGSGASRVTKTSVTSASEVALMEKLAKLEKEFRLSEAENRKLKSKLEDLERSSHGFQGNW